MVKLDKDFYAMYVSKVVYYGLRDFDFSDKEKEKYYSGLQQIFANFGYDGMDLTKEQITVALDLLDFVIGYVEAEMLEDKKLTKEEVIKLGEDYIKYLDKLLQAGQVEIKIVFKA